jgi:hypothetical protein
VVLLGLCLLVLPACGDGKLEVRGKVTFEGKPVEGVISFEPADGQGPTSGGTITGGRYELTGTARVAPGQKIVRIRGTRKTGRKVPAMAGPSPLVDDIERYIPARYNDQSQLQREVVAGKANEINFELQAKESEPRP